MAGGTQGAHDEPHRDRMSSVNASSRIRLAAFVPTALTAARLVLAPAVALLVLQESYSAALVVFALAAGSDLIDGSIARWLGVSSEVGARLDPLADKALMLGAAIPLAARGWLPVWLVAAVVVRDLVIVSGATAYRLLVGRIRISPTRLSKINTALEFLVTTLALAVAAAILEPPAWLPWLWAVVLATVLISGAQYVWVWGARALAARTASER
jgi:cardiolipin synthase